MSMMVDVLDRYRRDRTFEINQVAERQRERLLDVLGRQGTQATDLAESASHIAAATRDIAVEVSRMAAVADWTLPAIVEHLALAAERLGGVEEMLANPRETASSECYRDGTYALAAGWWEDAVNDLSQAVNLYRYNPRTWFNLGVAQHRHDSIDAAAEAFGRCALYGVSVDPALAARAVLIAASLHRTAERADASAKILREYAEKLDSCAEIHLALGVHHSDHDHLVEALALAPDLTIDARIGKAPGLEAAATAVCQMVDGPVHRLRAIEQLTTHVADCVRDAGLEGVQSPPASVNLPPDGGDALLLSHAALPDAVKVISGLTTEVRDAYGPRRAAADHAAKGISAARAEAHQAAQTVAQMERDARALATGLARENAWRKGWGQAWLHRQNQEGRRVWLEAWSTASEVSAQTSRIDGPAWLKAWSDAWEQTWKEQGWPQGTSHDRSLVWAVGEQVWVQAQERNGTRDTTASVTMPAVAGASEGTVTGWLKQVGNAVEADEPLLEVATDEVDAELPAPSSGILRQILVAEDETVEVGTTLAVISPPAYEVFADWEKAAEPAWDQVAGQAWEQARARLWRQIHQLAVGASKGAVPDQRVQETKKIFETHERDGDDRLDALQRDLSVLLAEPARQLAQKAQDKSEAMIGTAEERGRLAAEAAEVVSTAEASVQTAMQTAEPKLRIIPFDLPGQWKDLAG
jgi:biotin carboxyl carrier protein